MIRIRKRLTVTVLLVLMTATTQGMYPPTPPSSAAVDDNIQSYTAAAAEMMTNGTNVSYSGLYVGAGASGLKLNYSHDLQNSKIAAPQRSAAAPLLANVALALILAVFYKTLV